MVNVEGLTKVFQVPVDRRQSLKGTVVHLFRSGGHRRLEALKDVSFEVRKGEFFSIIGANGSGKSTLLKILAGIYQPTAGTVSLAGRLSPFIELGVGFNPELTARDNVFLNGAILGLERREVAEIFDDIIRFAELEEFVDQRLKNFSSGMLVRLAFAIAIRAHAEILLVDEVLAVGDANFQQKCFDVFSTLKAEGRTIIFVSHDLAAVRQFSDRVMLLDRGISRGIHSPSGAIAAYNQLNEQRANRALERAEAPLGQHGIAQTPRLAAVRMVARGEGTHVVHRGDEVAVQLTVRNPSRRPVQLGVAIHRVDGVYCFGTNTFLDRWEPVDREEITVELVYKAFPLQRGSYFLTVGVFGERERTVYEMRDHAFGFQVTQEDETEGLIHLEHAWRLC